MIVPRRLSLPCIALAFGATAWAAANPYITPAMEKAVDDALVKMTLEEKIKLCNGDIEGRTPEFRGGPEIKRLGIGPVIYYNGPRGFQAGTSTLFPAGVSLAASFDPELTGEVAGAIAAEARAGSTDIFEAPSINLIRDPLNGRTFEYFSEDPFLDSRLTAAYVRGAQDQGVAAVAKHLVVNDQETNRNEVDEIVDDRTLHEIYLPAFKAAIDAGVLGLMTGANRVNGEYASSSRHLLKDIIKDECGFPGFICTDWIGVRQTVEAANAGVDMSMPGKRNSKFSVERMLAAVKAGQVGEATITDKARRILRVYYFTGRMKGAPAPKKGEPPNAAHDAIALRAAQEGTVLLKNNRAALPIDPAKITSVAVLGPHAERHFPGGGSSSVQKMTHEITALAGIRARIGAAKVRYVPFDAGAFYRVVDKEFVRTGDAANEPGFLATYSGKRPNSDAEASFTQRVDGVDFNWEMASPDREKIDSANFRCRWTGMLTPPVDGAYGFKIIGPGGPRLFIDGKLALEKVPYGDKREGIIDLKAGRPVSIEVQYDKRGGQGADASVRLEWQRPDAGEQLAATMKEALDAAKVADAAIVCIGQDHSFDSEGIDRQRLELAPYQVAFVEAVARANPRTIVVLYTGSPVETASWMGDVPAVLLPWYPGVENGNAVASILFGDVNPGGKLPMTWPKRESDSPASQTRFRESKHEVVLHREGVFVGYRWYDEHKIEPAFPFGFGLSYSTFSFETLRLSTETFRPGDQPLELSVDVKNTGARAGSEVVQLYVHDVKSSVPRPSRELKGFQRVELKAGETKTVNFSLAADAFAFWSPATKKWTVEPGDFELQIGPSSRDLPLTAKVTVP